MAENRLLPVAIFICAQYIHCYNLDGVEGENISGKATVVRARYLVC